MTATVDLVIAAGSGRAARAVALGALLRRQRVLIVLGSAEVRTARRLRASLLDASRADSGLLTVITGAAVVCADGVDGMGAVVIRHLRTGRLSAVNASAFVEISDEHSGD